ncbi:MAG TPA: hypothetical protein DEU95_10545 [Chloroflexi bacterium]|nr:hypothetical protein [Chloroflexota bacterium]HBY45397.1 hypothetical protein [Chloroflexota bacterium]HCG30155.1 hypothetical protein [Chloroflexota bacterium]
MALFKRSVTSAPYEPRRVGPETPGALVFTLRSTPRHHDGIVAAIESTGSAKVYFSEPLAYLRGQGVALFRIEATGFDWLPNLYQFWRNTEAIEAFAFDIALYANNIDYVTTLRGLAPDDARRAIERAASQTPENPRSHWRTPLTH